MNRSLRSRLAFGSFLLLLSGGAAFAQQDDMRGPAALLGGMFMFFVVFGLALYVYVALALKTIAEKTHTENSWLAWIPIANIILMINIAKKPVWWILLFIVPIVNFIVAVIIWMAVAEARQKPSWWGILAIIPGLNLIVPGYLAWVD
jgi:phosphate starvation-inducible membrane PsiE